MARHLLALPASTTLALSLSLAAGTGCNSGSSSAADAGPGQSPPDASLPSLCDGLNVAGSLASIPGVTSVTEVACGPLVSGIARCYEASMRVPIIHGDPGRGELENWFKLIHRSCDAPTIVNTTGYALAPQFYVGELSDYYDTNWIELEHRYQGRSVPELAHWTWDGLTVGNGAADVHELLRIVRRFYGTPVVTSGVSKGGATAIYHRQLYPDDVDGTVPYVAPISLARVDPRYQVYIDTIGPQGCRDAVRRVQVEMATTRRAGLVPIAASAWGMPADQVGPTLDSMIGSLEWGFWQAAGVDRCAQVPQASASNQHVFDFIETALGGFGAAPADNVPAEDYRGMLALDWEWLTEQGFAEQVGDHVSGLIEAWSIEDTFRALTPQPLPAYDDTASARALDWVRSDADHLVAIYGAWDPWSGGMIPAPTGARAGVYVAPSAGHWAAISLLSDDDAADAFSRISEMLGREPDLGARSRAMTSERHRRTIEAERAARVSRSLRLRK